MIKKFICLLIAAASFAGGGQAQTIDKLDAGAAVSATDKFPAWQGANPATAPTAAQLKTFMTSLPTLTITAGQNTAPFLLGNGNSAVAFPVPALTPTSQNNIAFDIFPNGVPGDHGSSGAAWMDICNKDIINHGGSPFNCIHMGTFAADGHGVIGTTSFSGAANADLQFQTNGTAVFTMRAADLDIQFNKIYTVSTLPSCGSSQQGELTVVSDAASPTYNGVLTPGGSSAIPVFCNGTAWTAH